MPAQTGPTAHVTNVPGSLTQNPAEHAGRLKNALSYRCTDIGYYGYYLVLVLDAGNHVVQVILGGILINGKDKGIARYTILIYLKLLSLGPVLMRPGESYGSGSIQTVVMRHVEIIHYV